MLTNFLGSSFLIIAVFVIRALFARHTSRRFIYALWLIVLVRLLMPMPVFDLDIEIPLPISHDIGETADRETYYPPIIAENPDISHTQPTAENITPVEPVSPQPVEKNIDWAKVFNTVHIAGAGALALWFGYVNISLYTRLKKDRVKLETSHNLPVYKTNVLTTPCLFGVVKPAIYLTEAACDERHMNNVITHEMCHYRHWDNLWNFLGMVCVVMWWWSPLVWLSFFTAKRDGELACDELALEILGENGSRNYGVTLIEMAKNRPHHRLSMAATISGGAKEMKERITAIANKRKNVLWAVAVVAVIAVLCIVIGFSGKNAIDEKRQYVTEIFNKYAVQCEYEYRIQTFINNPLTMSDIEIEKAYKILIENGVEGWLEEMKKINTEAYGITFENFKIVTTLPLTKATDRYSAYDLFKEYFDKFYETKEYRTVFDKNGKDITSEFFGKTQKMYETDDWGGIITYFKNNVDHARLLIDNRGSVPNDWILEEYYLTEIELPDGQGTADMFYVPKASYDIDENGNIIKDRSVIGADYAFNNSRLKVTMSGGKTSVNPDDDGMNKSMGYLDVGYHVSEYEEPKHLKQIIYNIGLTDDEIKNNTPSDSNIDRLFNTIISEPLEHSSTEKYISAHKDEYEQLLSWNMNTLSYAFRGFEANVFGFGLKAEVIAHVCNDIIENDSYEVPHIEYTNANDWYSKIKEHARQLEQKYGAENLGKYDPWAELLLDISENMNDVSAPTENTEPTENNDEETTDNNNTGPDAPGSAYSYGIITDVIEIDRAGSINATYYFIINGAEQAHQTYGRAFGVKEGPARFEKTDGSITDIKNLEPFAITSIEGKKAVANGKKYDIAGDVQVYLHRNNTYSVINLAAVLNNDDYALSGYADGAVKVIIAEKLENMSAYTPVLIKSFDGETMVVDPVEYITTADTERIAELELDPVLDLPSGYYIHNETEESISLKVSGAVFEFVDWNRQFTKPDADLFYETSSAAEFLRYCGTYEGGIPANTPFFLNINGNNLLKLKEIILA